MGVTHVELTITSPSNPTLSQKGNFLVDSGASFTVLPKDFVDRLKLRSNFTREFTLADGKKVERQIGNASIKYGKEEIVTPVVLGRKGDNPLLGAITLESFGLLLDPFQRKLYKSTMMLWGSTD